MSSFRYNPSATLISLRPMSSKMCYLSPRTTVTHLSGLYRGVQRGRSPFCRVIEGVPQIYQVKGGRVGRER